MPKKLVLDTNLYVSYLASSNPESSVIRAVERAHRSHNLYQSPETFEELSEVLMRPKFAKYFSLNDVQALLDNIKRNATFVDHNFIAMISPDPKDNKFFALAEAVKADYILSGDKRDVLSIYDYKNARTISPAAFIDPKDCLLSFSHNASEISRHRGILLPEDMDLV